MDPDEIVPPGPPFDHHDPNLFQDREFTFDGEAGCTAEDIVIEFMKTERVCELNISDVRDFNELVGEVSRFTDLEHIDICNSDLMIIPPEIGLLTKLESLWLRDNRLARLPSSISKLTNLGYLDLRTNYGCRLPAEFRGMYYGFNNCRIQLRNISEYYSRPARDAAYAILLCAKKINLHRDPARMIARMLLISVDDEIWHREFRLDKPLLIQYGNGRVFGRASGIGKCRPPNGCTAEDCAKCHIYNRPHINHEKCDRPECGCHDE